jgi:hypothetical protein
MVEGDDDGRISSVDVANYEILDAIRDGGCALCHVQVRAERRLVESFLREGRYTPEAREVFVLAGGFCRRHAWQLHEAATTESTGAGIADIYGQLVRHDLRWLEETRERLSTRCGRRKARHDFRRRFGCPLCASMARSNDSHGYFLGQLLTDQRARDAFSAGEGLCTAHLETAVRQALRADRGGNVARFLLEDARARLSTLSDQLEEYDRKRDYRYAGERGGEEQRSWTDVIRRCVGSRR